MGLLWFVAMFVVYSVLGWFLACDCGVLLLLWWGVFYGCLFLLWVVVCYRLFVRMFLVGFVVIVVCRRVLIVWF